MSVVHPAAEYDGHRRRAHLHEVSGEAGFVDGSDGDGVDGAYIAVGSAVVAAIPAVARSPDEDVSLAFAPVFAGLGEGGAGQLPRTLHRLAVVFWAPRGRVDVNVVVVEEDRLVVSEMEGGGAEPE